MTDINIQWVPLCGSDPAAVIMNPASRWCRVDMKLPVMNHHWNWLAQLVWGLLRLHLTTTSSEEPWELQKLFCNLAQMCASPQFLWPLDSLLLCRELWAVRSYIDYRCVSFLIKSNFKFNQTELDSSEGAEPSQGGSEEMNSLRVKYVSQQRLWILMTMLYFSFSFLINL